MGLTWFNSSGLMAPALCLCLKHQHCSNPPLVQDAYGWLSLCCPMATFFFCLMKSRLGIHSLSITTCIIFDEIVKITGTLKSPYILYCAFNDLHFFLDKSFFGGISAISGINICTKSPGSVDGGPFKNQVSTKYFLCSKRH
jgi:F0F1-type ATP synthase assembly protein I